MNSDWPDGANPWATGIIPNAAVVIHNTLVAVVAGVVDVDRFFLFLLSISQLSIFEGCIKSLEEFDSLSEEFDSLSEKFMLLSIICGYFVFIRSVAKKL